jgi:hypothetical protein
MNPVSCVTLSAVVDHWSILPHLRYPHRLRCSVPLSRVVDQLCGPLRYHPPTVSDPTPPCPLFFPARDRHPSSPHGVDSRIRDPTVSAVLRGEGRVRGETADTVGCSCALHDGSISTDDPTASAVPVTCVPSPTPDDSRRFPTTNLVAHRFDPTSCLQWTLIVRFRLVLYSSRSASSTGLAVRLALRSRWLWCRFHAASSLVYVAAVSRRSGDRFLTGSGRFRKVWSRGISAPLPATVTPHIWRTTGVWGNVEPKRLLDASDPIHWTWSTHSTRSASVVHR